MMSGDVQVHDLSSVKCTVGTTKKAVTYSKAIYKVLR
jgi:hypothetical protein